MKKIPLYGKVGEGRFLLVDDEDYEMMSRYRFYGRLSRNTMYAIVKIRDVAMYAHRLVMRIYDGKIFLDHKNGDGLDCQKHNLRRCTYSQNSMNMSMKKGDGHTSKYKGVYKLKAGRNRPWRARVIKNDKEHAQYFATEIEAVLWYNETAISLFGEFAKPNVVDF